MTTKACLERTKLRSPSWRRLFVGVALLAPIVGCDGKTTASNSPEADASNPSDTFVPSEQDTRGMDSVPFPTPDAHDSSQDAVSVRDTSSVVETLPDTPAAVLDEGRVDAALDSNDPFCSGDTPKVMLAGRDGRASVIKAAVLPLDCCDAVEFNLGAEVTAMPISVTWQLMGGAISRSEPAWVDLSSPSESWRVAVQVGCHGMATGCTPTYFYATARNPMQGHMVVRPGQGNSHSETTLCLTAAPSQEAGVDTPSIRVYFPNVVAK